MSLSSTWDVNKSLKETIFVSDPKLNTLKDIFEEIEEEQEEINPPL